MKKKVEPGAIRPTRVKVFGDRGGNVTVEFWIDRDDWSSVDRDRINEIQASGRFEVEFRFQGPDKVFTVHIPMEEMLRMKWSDGVLEQFLRPSGAGRLEGR